METCVKFQRKIFEFKVVGVHQSFQFFRQNTWFPEKNRGLSKFLYWIWHYLISIMELKVCP